MKIEHECPDDNSYYHHQVQAYNPAFDEVFSSVLPNDRYVTYYKP